MELTKKHKKIAEFEKAVANLNSEIETVDIIKSEVSSFFKLSKDSLNKKTRLRTYLWPRQIAIYFVRKYTTFGLLDIAKMFGLTNHATALHSVNVIKRDMQCDKRRLNQINLIELNLFKNGIQN